MLLKNHWARCIIAPSSLLAAATLCLAAAGDNSSATILALDSLTSFRESATIEARLTMAAPQVSLGLAGESLELLYGGKVVATAVTGRDGRATFHYAHKARGNTPLIVKTAEGSSVSVSGNLTMAAWERRSPILMVEMSALTGAPDGKEPLADAADELGKLTQFYYRVIYVVQGEWGMRDAFQASTEVREWLYAHEFPVGYVLVLPESDGALGSKIDELRDAGWTTIKTGIGRTKSFAEAFVQRRLEAVMVPEPSKTEKARKAKVAKVWKDVRKHF